MIVFDVCATLFVFSMTVLVGGPIAARLARIQVFRAPNLADARGERPPVHTAFFEPVDFGPDNMTWPSQVDRPRHSRALPEWPSAKWDDPHFGKGSSATARAKFAEAITSAAANRPQAQSARQQAPVESKPSPKPRPKPTAKATPKPRPKPKTKSKRKAKPAPPPAAPPTNEVQAGVPDDAVERLVAERGLAGAVQFLMQQNGWDFRTAASFVANNRKR